MKTKIVWLFTIILMQACVAQKQTPKKKESNVLNQTNVSRVIDTKDTYDVILADITKGSMFSLYFGFDSFSEGTHFFDLSLQSLGQLNFDSEDNKQFTFFDDGKRMKIKCECGRNKNYYIKNLKVKEGKYELTYNRTIKTEGDKINVSDSIQNTLFKNIKPNIHTKPKNIYFKDLEFVVLDLADTLNVKLKKVN